MEKIITIVVALVAVFAVNAADLTTAVKTKITNAVKNGDFVAAAQWSATLNNLKQAEFAEKQTQLVKKADEVATVYTNVLKSAPVVLDGIALYTMATDPDANKVGSDGYKLIHTLELISKVLNRPLTKKDVAPIVSELASEEEKRQEAMRKEADKHISEMRKFRRK